MNLSLTGNLGSGKSSVGRELIARGFEIVSSGDIFRGLAAEKGISIVEMNKIAETDKSIDKMVDDRTIALGKERDHTIFDSRMGWHFVPDSFKVFMMVDLAEAGERVYRDAMRQAESYEKPEDAVEALYRRQSLEKSRYGQLYGVNYYDLDNYDLVIDTTGATPVQIAEEIIRRFEQFEAGDRTKHIEICPKRIYPLCDVSSLDAKQVVQYQDGKADACFEQPQTVTLHEGRWYALDAQEMLLAAQKGKKPFLCVSIDRDRRAEGMSAQLCAGYEKEAGFTYHSYPEEKLAYSNEQMYW